MSPEMPQPLMQSHPSTQYGARALSCVLTTILSQTESKVPLPQGYPGGDAAFFCGELGCLCSQGYSLGCGIGRWICIGRPSVPANTSRGHSW